MRGELRVLLALCSTTLGLGFGLLAMTLDSQFQIMGMILGLAMGVPVAKVWQRRRRNTR